MGSSIHHGITLNEVQSHLGEPLLSMNLDTFLKNVFPLDTTAGEYATGSRPLSNKTVEEVWNDIQRRKAGDESSVQPTLGEMTLEDFLVRAGVPAAGADDTSNSTGNATLSGQAAHLLQQYQQQQNLMGAYVPARSVRASAGRVSDGACPESQASMPLPMMGALLNVQTSGRKRAATEEVPEKTMERRQKRMIKNRESAARSRARKQAYTNELENKVTRLEEENERLRNEKKLNSILHLEPPPGPKHQLRRTSSAAF